MASISQIFESILRQLTTLTGSYAIGIIILTIIIKMAMWPLTVSQLRMTEQMKKIGPKRKALEEKYKGKPQELQQRTMELYKEHKINPMSGCLPMLLSLPILMILYRVFLNEQFIRDLAETGANVGFLWMRDLAMPDPIILPILSGLTTWVTMQQGAGAEPSQKSMTMVMPIVFGFITTRLPAGAAIYWVVTNLVTMVQHYFILKGFAAKGGETS